MWQLATTWAFFNQNQEKNMLETKLKLGFCACGAYSWSFGEAIVGEFAIEPVFMHNPVGFLSFGSSPFVENKSLLHPNKASSSPVNFFIFSCCLPVPRFCSSIRSHTSWIFPVSLAEEIPFLLSHLRLFCSKTSLFQRLDTQQGPKTQQQIKMKLRMS